MMRKFYAFLILSIIVLSNNLYAQSGPGELRGKVIDSKTKEGLPFAAVVVEQSGSQVAYTTADFDGNFIIKPITPGKYDVRVKIIGYNERLINGVIITSNRQTYLNPDLVASVKNLQEVTVTDYAKPLIEKDNVSAGGTLTAEEIVRLPTRNINSLVSTTAGIYQADEGGALSIKGSRSDANDTYIDGVKVRGIANLPQNAIEQITVITGGVPAQYGDATGGIITITSKGPSKKFYGGVEAVTSEFLDGYGYNLISANVAGPLLLKKGDDQSNRPLLGFFASGELETRRDQSPSYVGAYRAKDDFLERVRSNPGTFAYNTAANRPAITVFPTVNLATNDNLEKTKAQDNNENRNFNFNTRLDFQPTQNSIFALGLSGTLQRSRLFSRGNMLFNSDNNGEQIRNSFRVFARYTQKFNQGDQDSKALLKNAYYTIQADFSRDNIKQQDINHQDNLFNYGYIGKYTTLKGDAISLLTAQGQRDTIFGTDGNIYTYSNINSLNGKVDTAFSFQGADNNPYLANWNTSLLNFIEARRAENPNDNRLDLDGPSDFQNLTGILNGQGILSAYGGLFTSPGIFRNGYFQNVRDQFRVSAIASADIKNHSIQVGVEYEQRVESRYTIAPSRLWTIMRQQQNAHLLLDRSAYDATTRIADVNGTGVRVSGDTILFSTINAYDANTTTFAKNIREKLGLQAGDFVDIDSYDPSMFSLDMFTANELINNLNTSGVAYSYSGFDYTGKKSSDNVSFQDFFRDTENRPIGAFRPIYVAGFIQDKFTFKDIIFSIGLRIDRFDANQQVLKDKYTVFERRNASELGAGLKPANIPDDAAVYVDESNSGTTVRGFRSGDVFYDANGNVVTDVNTLRSSSTGTLTPWLASSAFDANGEEIVTEKAFKDYEPQTQYMPRLGFSFPISDEANFFANYDVLTQRPRNENTVFSNPMNYYLQSQRIQNVLIVSPDIRPERTINYQLGFKQRVGQTSALTLTAFYRELRDNFQQVLISTAYPTSYSTFTNRDFGSIKGFTVQYDLRRTNNISINAAYTLQFAIGTGSNASSAANLIASGESEPIRVPLPLDYDQRHTLVTTVDYRWGAGTSYNGPENLKFLLEQFGANFIFRAGSGTPYSRISQDIVQNILNASDTRFRTLVGEINGSRLPWQFNVDVRLDKDITFTSNSADGKGKTSNLNVYLLVQNLFDLKRVANVYPATGLPDDDGFLASAQANALLSEAESQQAYIDLYRIRVNDPGNFRLPRVIRLGAIYSF